jgi:hypothetical protein
MTAPLAVATRGTLVFNPGTGLPLITPTGVTITSQEVLNEVIASANSNGISLLLGGQSGGTVTAPAYVRTVNGTSPDATGDVEVSGGGGGAVTSVNGHVGVVVLAASDVSADAAGAASSAATAVSVAKQNLPSYAAGRSNTLDRRLSIYNAHASNTRRWRAGIGRAGRADYGSSAGMLHELWLGDSIMGGCTGLGQQTGPDTTRFDRLDAGPRFHERALSALTGITIASTGFVRCCDNSHIDARFALAGGAANNSTTIGLVTNATLTFTTNFAGDTVVVGYYDNFGTAALTISVNGASSGAGFVTVTGTSSSKYKSVTLTGISGLTVGSTIVMKAILSSTIQVSFIEVRNATTGGIAVHNVALSGSQATINAAAPTSPAAWTYTGSGYAAIRQLTDSTALPFVPDVVHLGWGLFDQVNGATSSQYHDAITTICGDFPNSDVVLHGLPTPVSLTDAQWTPFVAALYQVADELDLPLLDFHDLTGGGAKMATLGLTADTTAHYLQPVYEMWGRAITKLAA